LSARSIFISSAAITGSGNSYTLNAISNPRVAAASQPIKSPVHGRKGTDKLAWKFHLACKSLSQSDNGHSAQGVFVPTE
jgi:hypothetical protein